MCGFGGAAWPVRKAGYFAEWAAAGEVWLISALCGMVYSSWSRAYWGCGLEIRSALGVYSP